MGKLKATRFHDRFDLDVTLRDASFDEQLTPTQRMIAGASIGKPVEDAYYSVRELREAAVWVHEGDPDGKPRLASILSNDGTDDYQRCIYYCLAGRGVVAMLDDLMWLEDLLEARGIVAGKLMRAKVRQMPAMDPYVSAEPDGPVGVVSDDFRQGPSWWMDPTLAE
jgi:hypothetical protein